MPEVSAQTQLTPSSHPTRHVHVENDDALPDLPPHTRTHRLVQVWIFISLIRCYPPAAFPRPSRLEREERPIGSVSGPRANETGLRRLGALCSDFGG